MTNFKASLIARANTEVDRELLVMIEDMIETRGFPPSRREIMERFGWVSTSSAQFHVKRLQEQGLISVEDGISRGIRVTRSAMKAATEELS